LSNLDISRAERVLEEVIQADDTLDKFGEGLEEAATLGAGRFVKVGKVMWEKLSSLEKLDSETMRENFFCSDFVGLGRQLHRVC